MKMPWANKTGLAKAAAFFATLFLLSLGLCGVNFVSVLAFVPFNGSAAPHGWGNALGSLLSITADIELIGIIVGLIGMFVVGLSYLGTVFSRRNSEEDKDQR